MRVPRTSAARTALLVLTAIAAASAYAAQPADLRQGQELFTRTWVAYDSRAATGGDGLGPMYNASSCVACHDEGGVGGGGTKDRNVRLVRVDKSTPFVVDHRMSTLSARPLGTASGTRVERNTPALFGAGLVDSIPDSVLVALAATETGDISGRVPRTAEGKVGRFGWKAHTASLTDFVATACANELGLAVDGHQQGQPPAGELYDRLSLMQTALRHTGNKVDLFAGPRRDMTDHEVASLTAYVGALPRPVELTNQPGRDTGHKTFATLGCEGCHVQEVGVVKGIYSDLLLHDLGRSLSDEGGSYETRGNTKAILSSTPKASASTVAMLDGEGEDAGSDTDNGLPESAEWRTPPLWGVRDSAPYLHDGRAVTLDDAIRAHGGEAAASVTAYNALPLDEQQAMVAFLESLAAPVAIN